MIDLRCNGLDKELCPLLQPHLESAANSLELAADFFSFSLMIDDFPEASEPWLHLLKSFDPAETRSGAVLFCAESSFTSLNPASGTEMPPVEIWDQAPAPRQNLCFDPGSFSEKRSLAFLHHELFLAQDLVQGRIIPSALANGQIEAFSSTWAVTVDGRLARRGLPGYSMAQRRAQFSRLFSGVGVLLPDHWQIFQSLWDGGLSDWKDVLGAIRHLPRL